MYSLTQQPFLYFYKNEFNMNGLIVTAKNQSEYKFLHDLLKKLNIESTPLSETELEDLGLSVLMKKVDRTKKVSREKIMKKLKG